MKNILFPAIAAASVLVPAVASAQSIPDAKVGVVNVETVIETCNACRTAFAQLEQQAQQIRTLETQLSTPLQTEGQAIQTEVNALNGGQPGQALQQKVQAFEQKRQQAAAQIQARQQTFNRNRNYVLQQISQQLDPAYGQVVSRRNLTLLVPTNSTLAHSPSIEVTNDVLAQLNSTLTTIATTAPAQQQQQQQPQGR